MAAKPASFLWSEMFRRAYGYLLGSYRIATAPEPNSSRPTSFKREKAEEEFTLWQRYMRDLASAENIVVKIGGLVALHLIVRFGQVPRFHGT